ncbi:TonB-dependent receptor [Phenylobacterium soli]|uniref:TonB-dependent receptor n=1 Tax=Phenylobacterium soli TaxID=2170551 RepID=A0A328AN41_9CAUL|nr:TonB-dependent receptor [Phenylobacterium soli]RAK54844.1 TonB-dependent receptor [Phenylobacterium soli]
MLGGLALSLAATGVDAAEARYRLSIPQKPYADALIDLGVQANVSVIGTSACGSGGMTGLVGILTLDEALGRLLEGAPCAYRILDPRTVRIGPPPPPKPTEPPPRPPTLVTELLVTATKRPASSATLPAAVSVVSREQVEMTGAADVLTLTGQVAGVLTTNLGPGRDKLILRGLSDGAFTGRARSTVGTYLDDAPINYNAPDPDLQLVDLERIEVIRGPQGALYGSGSISGVFRIVPRKPDMSGFAFGAAGQAAYTEGGSDSYEIEGYGNIPLVQDHAALRVVGYRDQQGGYIDNRALRLSNVDRTTREGGRIALRLQPSDDWQLDLSGTAQRLRLADTQYTTPDAGPTGRATRVREGHKNDFAVGAATLRGELGWATFRSSVSYIEHTFSSQYDASQILGDFLRADPSDIGVYLERTGINMVSQDTVLRSSRVGPVTWLVGVYSMVSIEKSPSSIDVQSNRGTLQRVYTEKRRDRLNEGAVYGEITYAFAPGWQLAAGGRLFNTDVHTESGLVAKMPGVSRSLRNKRHFDGFLPKVSLQREISSGVVYGLFSEGYRPGGFNTGGFNYPFLIASRAYFDPDRLRNYELGFKTRLFDRRLSLRSAAFFDRWTKIQTDQYRPSGLAYTANVGNADIKGLETELAYEFDFGLSLQANAIFASSRVRQTNPDFAQALISGLPSAPRFSGGVLAVYQHPLPHDLSLRLVGETNYIGRSQLSFDARQEADMGQYTNTRFSAEVAGKSWNATVFISNPFDVAGDTFAYGNPFTFGTKRQSTPQRPRTIGVRLAANY